MIEFREESPNDKQAISQVVAAAFNQAGGARQLWMEAGSIRLGRPDSVG